MASRKTKAPKKAGEPKPGFEEALGELEALVEAMENEQLPLEQLVTNYEKGSKLLSHCQQVLESARERIELITLDAEGDSALENTTPRDDVGANPPASQGSDPDDDDIRLF